MNGAVVDISVKFFLVHRVVGSFIFSCDMHPRRFFHAESLQNGPAFVQRINPITSIVQCWSNSVALFIE